MILELKVKVNAIRPTIYFSNKEISIKTFYSKQNLHIKLMFDYYNVILKD